MMEIPLPNLVPRSTAEISFSDDRDALHSGTLPCW